MGQNAPSAPMFPEKVMVVVMVVMAAILFSPASANLLNRSGGGRTGSRRGP